MTSAQPTSAAWIKVTGKLPNHYLYPLNVRLDIIFIRTFVEEHKFMEGPYYAAMVEDVSRRVGVQLNTEDVELAWALCR